MTGKTHPGFWADFRKFFGRGLAILLPTVLTLWLLWQASLFVFATVAEPINRGIRVGTMQVMPNLFAPETGARRWWHINEPAWWHVDAQSIERFQGAREARGLRRVSEAVVVRSIRGERFREQWVQHWYLEGTGLVVAIVLIYFAGLIVTNYLGRKIYHLFEGTLSRVPVFKQVYPHVKQLVEMVLGDKPMAFKRVVLVQYPRAGLWTIGLVTSNTFTELRRAAGGGEMVTVFIPSSPTPFTGYVVNVPRSEVVDIQMSIDQALRFVVTGGILTPDERAGSSVRAEALPVDPAAGAARPEA